ncbi:hypothetical protein M422DRAFT_147223, partial [Sphaerobolus stellatus SS14]
TPEWLVYTDESTIDLCTTYRLMGWDHRGQWARIQAGFQCGQRYSLLPALTQDGIIYSDIKLGAYDGPSFITFLEGLLEHMNPYPAPWSVLILDNCAIHHVKGVREQCEQHGVKILYLPPYSPNLKPIEEAFSFVKAYLQFHGAHV